MEKWMSEKIKSKLQTDFRINREINKHIEKLLLTAAASSVSCVGAGVAFALTFSLDTDVLNPSMKTAGSTSGASWNSNRHFCLKNWN